MFKQLQTVISGREQSPFRSAVNAASLHWVRLLTEKALIKLADAVRLDHVVALVSTMASTVLVEKSNRKPAKWIRVKGIMRRSLKCRVSFLASQHTGWIQEMTSVAFMFSRHLTKDRPSLEILYSNSRVKRS